MPAFRSRRAALPVVAPTPAYRSVHRSRGTGPTVPLSAKGASGPWASREMGDRRDDGSRRRSRSGPGRRPASPVFASREVLQNANCFAMAAFPAKERILRRRPRGTAGPDAARVPRNLRRPNSPASNKGADWIDDAGLDRARQGVLTAAGQRLSAAPISIRRRGSACEPAKHAKNRGSTVRPLRTPESCGRRKHRQPRRALFANLYGR